VLHTWGHPAASDPQPGSLHFHPHLHCVVPGGGLSPDGQRWIAGRRRFLLPVKVLSRRFRRLFLHALEKACAAGKLQFFGDLQTLRDPPAFTRYLAPLRKQKWVVYAKAPFGGPQHVLEYLGRYTHRVAISNRRLLALENGQVSFAWKDYRDGGKDKVMTVSAEEFIRRFLQHALPPGFQPLRGNLKRFGLSGRLQVALAAAFRRAAPENFCRHAVSFGGIVTVVTAELSHQRQALTTSPKHPPAILINTQ